MKNMKNWLKKRFITGLILILPTAVSLGVVIKIFKKVDGIFTPLISKLLGYNIPGLGFILTIFLIWIVGIIGTRVIGKQLFLWIDNLMLRIPVIKSIYSTTRQLINAFELTKKLPFKKAILFEYPRKGILALGFETGKVDNKISNIIPLKLLNIFFITTPNPTSGFLYFVPESEVIPLDMNIEDALKIVISGGIYTPSYPENSELINAMDLKEKYYEKI